MSVTFPTANPLVLSTSTQTFLTVPSTSGLVARDLVVKITNSTAATRLVSVYGVPSGGTASTGNAVAYEMSVPPKDYVLIPVGRLGASGTVQAAADATGLLITLESGNYYTP